MVCAARGYRCAFTTPETMSKERRALAEEMAAADSRYFVPQQFSNCVHLSVGDAGL